MTPLFSRFGPARVCRTPAAWVATLALAIGLGGCAISPGSGPDAASSPLQGSTASTVSHFCDRAPQLTAVQQDILLRFAAVVRTELDQVADGEAVLISRSGLDLSRFDIRYSHAAIAWRNERGMWSARQLYYACDEGRPRIFDQGLAGFVMGTDNPTLGYISLVRLPAEAAQALRETALDTPRALRLLAARYSANAYPFSLRYQNCNQWVLELLATAWGQLPDGDDLRARAQAWLQQADYAPQPVAVQPPWLMLASVFVPLVHLNDHPREDRAALQLQVSLPATLEAFVRQQHPSSQRVELCHDSQHVVVRRGWEPVADGCQPTASDSVVPL